MRSGSSCAARCGGSLEIEPGNDPHGFRPVYFYGRQIDDAKAWTSAMFIEFA